MAFLSCESCDPHFNVFVRSQTDGAALCEITTQTDAVVVAAAPEDQICALQQASPQAHIASCCKPDITLQPECIDSVKSPASAEQSTFYPPGVHTSAPADATGAAAVQLPHCGTAFCMNLHQCRDGDTVVLASLSESHVRQWLDLLLPTSFRSHTRPPRLLVASSERTCPAAAATSSMGASACPGMQRLATTPVASGEGAPDPAARKSEIRTPNEALPGWSRTCLRLLGLSLPEPLWHAHCQDHLLQVYMTSPISRVLRLSP
jgi:hypothetical protein